MDISSKECIPCGGGLEKLSIDNANSLKQAHTPEWQVIEGGKKLYREFKFKNFKHSQDFVNKVGEIAELEGHHPDISFGWGYANITIYTHAIEGLHENDFILAAKIDKLDRLK